MAKTKSDDVTRKHTSSKGTYHQQAAKQLKKAKKSTKFKKANAYSKKAQPAFKFEKVAENKSGATLHLPGYENPDVEDFTKRFFLSKYIPKPQKRKVEPMAPITTKPKLNPPKPIINGIFMETRKRVNGPPKTFMLFNGTYKEGQSQSRKMNKGSTTKPISKINLEHPVPPPREPIEKFSRGNFKERIEAIIRNKKHMKELKKAKKAGKRRTSSMSRSDPRAKSVKSHEEAVYKQSLDEKLVRKVSESGLFGNQKPKRRIKTKILKSLRSRLQQCNVWKKLNNG